MKLLIIVFTKLLRFLTRLFRFGGGTSFPGLFIEKVYPGFLKDVAGKYKHVILITGTNGKTTTQQFLHHLLTNRGYTVAANKSGANLLRGIATMLVQDCSLFGKPRSDIAVIEVEEATMPIIANHISPHFILVTNLFRDQLDAYGEVVTTRKYIVDAIQKCPEAVIVLNKDDRNVHSISSEIANPLHYISIQDKRVNDIFYERDFVDFSTRVGNTEVSARSVRVEHDLSTRFIIQTPEREYKNIHFVSPGLQNIYNALGAFSIANAIEPYQPSDLQRGFSSFNSAFGRGEVIEIHGKKVRLLLVKNPASVTANLHMLRNILDLKLLIIINDKIADGKDVSWLWDAHFELLNKTRIGWITVSGTRALDMGVRLKYTDIGKVNTAVEQNLEKALHISLSKLRSGETLFILPTYTAMLEIRKIIGNMVNVKEFWK